MSDVIDADVVDDHEPELVPAHEGPALSTAVARRERRSEVIKPLDADELVASFQQYQALLPKLLDAGDYQAAGFDKEGKPRRFVKKSGWRKIATAFDLDVILIRSTVDRDPDGQPIRAEVWARAIAPSGRTMDGDGYCDVGEDRFKKASARQKLENDLRATATTRAMNRAISGLVGMGEVSAEEMDSKGTQGPAYGPVVSEKLRGEASAALVGLLGGRETVARERWGAVQADLGYMPEAVAKAIVAFAANDEVPWDPEP